MGADAKPPSLKELVELLYDELWNDQFTIVDAFFWYVLGGVTMFMLTVVL